MQGRDLRRPVSLHHASTAAWRPVMQRPRPVSMTRRTPGISRLIRAVMHLNSQETARNNAAGASAKLRKRRQEREEVDAYLEALHSPISADTS